jgi:WHEP-TRS domain/OB-fold nucleic acid binding domain
LKLFRIERVSMHSNHHLYRVPLVVVATMLLGMLRSLPVRSFTTTSLRRQIAQPRIIAGQLDHRCTPHAVLSVKIFSTLSPSELGQLNDKIKLKGNEIRQLKESGVEKNDLAPHIEELKALKAQLPVDEGETQREKSKKQKKDAVIKEKPAAVKKAIEEMSESELRLNRLSKIETMKEAGVEPFEYTFQTTHTASKLAAQYDGKLEEGQEDESADVAVAGRIMTRRVFGKLAFFTLQDETGMIQLQFDKSRLEESFQVR